MCVIDIVAVERPQLIQTVKLKDGVRGVFLNLHWGQIFNMLSQNLLPENTVIVADPMILIQ